MKVASANNLWFNGRTNTPQIRWTSLVFQIPLLGPLSNKSLLEPAWFLLPGNVSPVSSNDLYAGNYVLFKGGAGMWSALICTDGCSGI